MHVLNILPYTNPFPFPFLIYILSHFELNIVVSTAVFSEQSPSVSYSFYFHLKAAILLAPTLNRLGQKTVTYFFISPHLHNSLGQDLSKKTRDLYRV